MNFPLLVGLPIALFLSSFVLAGWFRRYALARGLVDVPNPRSSHSVATPRGGGVAIVVPTLIALLMLGAIGALAWPSVYAFAGAGAIVALVGFVDDHRQIAPRWRLIGHFAAAAWILVWFGGQAPLPALGFLLHLPWLGDLLACLWIVWLLNLTNFMDGIDGIAAIEVMTVCVCGVLLYATAAPGVTTWVVPLILASATLGFLVWNWPPAKIFVGDAGSGFLGLMLAALSLQAGWVAPTLFWSWVILLGVFVVDATVTLIRRVIRGEKFYESHRSHAYQYAAQKCGAHKPVTLAVGAINLCWLFPIAALVAMKSLNGPVGVLIAYAPLVAAAFWLEAGKPAAK